MPMKWFARARHQVLPQNGRNFKLQSTCGNNTDHSSTLGNKVPLLKKFLWPVAVSTLVPKAAWSSG